MNTNEMLKQIRQLELEGKLKEAEKLHNKLQNTLTCEIKQLKNNALNFAFKLNKIKNAAERVL